MKYGGIGEAAAFAITFAWSESTRIETVWTDTTWTGLTRLRAKKRLNAA